MNMNISLTRVSIVPIPCLPKLHPNQVVRMGGDSGSTGTAPKRQSFNLRASLFKYPPASRLMVKNLPYSINESRLEEEFSNFGEIAEVMLAKDRVSNRSKGYAFIQYTCQDDAMLALENMDYKTFDGRMIYVELAKPGRDVYGGYPKTSGPPKERPKLEPEEVADCWY